MSHLNGIDLLKSILVKPIAIFTTAYPDFVVEVTHLKMRDIYRSPTRNILPLNSNSCNIQTDDLCSIFLMKGSYIRSQVLML